MLLASLHSMFETGFLMLILTSMWLHYVAKKFADKHPEAAKQSTQVIGNLILRQLKKW